MAYQKQTWRDFDDTKTDLQNINNGAVVTPERLNHIENGIANLADNIGGGSVDFSAIEQKITETKVSLTAQLQQKAQELDIKKRDKNVQIGLNDADGELLAAIEGGEGTSFDLLSEPRERSVTEEKMSQVKIKRVNLYNYKTDYTPDKYVNAAGNVLTASGWGHGRIPVEGAQNYSVWLPFGQYSGHIGGIGFYNDDVLISKISIASSYVNGVYNGSNFITITTPENANNFRITNKRASDPVFDNSLSLIVVKGDVIVEDEIDQLFNASFVDKTARDKINELINDIDFSLPLKGKTWVAVGDSITEANSRTTSNYHKYISDETGIEVVNMGLSGSGYKKRDGTGHSFYQRISSVPSNADVVTIFGGGNDLSLILGEATDTGTETICGCVNTALDNYYSILPTTPIGIITPSPWVQYPNHEKGNKMELLADALLEICEIRSVPCLDLYRASNLRPWDEEFRTLMYSRDEGNGVHPDENGHKIIASKIREFLKTLI